MSYKTSNAEGPVDFINTYDLEPMAQQVIPKAALATSRVELRTRSLYARTFELLIINSLFLIRSVMWKIQALRLNLLEKSCLHQSSWRLLQPIN